VNIPSALQAVSFIGKTKFLAKQLAATLNNGKNKSTCLEAITSEKREIVQRDLAIKIGMQF